MASTLHQALNLLVQTESQENIDDEFRLLQEDKVYGRRLLEEAKKGGVEAFFLNLREAIKKPFK